MLGRLFASASSSSSTAHHNHHPPPDETVLPVSVLEEADTRGLLYGSTNNFSEISNNDLASKDIRVVMLVDLNYMDDYIYDSNRPQHHEHQGRTVSPSYAPGASSSSSSSSSSKTTKPSSSSRKTGNHNRRATFGGNSPGVTSTPCSTNNTGNNNHRAKQTQIQHNNPLNQPPTPPNGPTSSYFMHTNRSMEHVPLPVVKDVLFGSAPMRFSDTVTKLHPVTSSTDKSRRTWVVSRLFKVGLGGSSAGSISETAIPTSIIPDDSNPPFPFQTSNINTANQNQSKHYDQKQSKIDDREDSNPENSNLWNPRCSAATTILHGSGGASTGGGALTQDIRCGFCVFFNLPAESDILTSHWEELSIALSDLQKTVYQKLCEALPAAAMRDNSSARTSYNNSSSGNGCSITNGWNCRRKKALSLDGDETIKIAVDYFRSRFFGVVKIPRVICGQDRWAELLHEIGWCLSNLESQEDCFLGNIIASFIKCNRDLVSRKTELTAGAVGDPPTRTVIISNNRIPSRRLLFILTSLIHDRSSEQRAKFLQQMAWSSENAINVRSTAPSAATNDDTASTASSSSPASRTSRTSGTSAIFSERGGGWEIPKSVAPTAGESTSTCTMPHVIRPSFSNTSLSSSLNKSTLGTATRYPSIEGLRRNFFNTAATSATTTNTATASAFSNGAASNSGVYGTGSAIGSASSGEATSSSSSSGGLFTSSGSNNSFFSLWPSSSSAARSDVGSLGSATSADEIEYYSMDTNMGDLSSSLPVSASLSTGKGHHHSGSNNHNRLSSRPKLNRWNSDHHRTATTLFSPNTVSGITRDMSRTSLQDTDDDHDADHEHDYGYGDDFENLTYDLVEEDDGSLVMEVQPVETEPLYEPIVLPPVAGHIPDFHPDFGIQAVSMHRELENKIARAMVRDSERSPIPKWVSNWNSRRPSSGSNSTSRTATPSAENGKSFDDISQEQSVKLSRTLVVNLKTREIYEIALIRTCCVDSGCAQFLHRSKMFGPSVRKAAMASHDNKAHCEDISSWGKQVGDYINEVISLDSGLEAVELLKQGFKTTFGLPVDL